MTTQLRALLVAGVISFAALTVYTQYVFLHTTDHVTGRPFRDASLDQYHDILNGQRPFPFQWRVAGPWLVRAVELATGADPHLIDAVVKTIALAGSALFLIAFTALWTTPLGSLLAGAMYFALTAGAYSSEGYSIYYTNDFLMVLGWFAAVYFAARSRYTAAAVATFLAVWAKETLVLVPLLMGLLWWQRKAPLPALLLAAVAFLIPEAILRTTYPAPLSQWAWWSNLALNVPFVQPDNLSIVVVSNLKLLLLFNVLWLLASRTAVRTADVFLRSLAVAGAFYLAIAYVVVYLRELRHFLPLAIVVIPLATIEIERLIDGLRRGLPTRITGVHLHNLHPQHLGYLRHLRPPAVWAFLSSRLLLVVTAYATLTLFPIHTLEPWMTQMFPGNNWLDGWVRWDAFWYEAIVDSANPFLPQGHSSANFFPFYAWAAWAISLPLQLVFDYAKAFYLGGLLLSHVAFLTGLAGVFRIAETMAGRGVAERTVWLMAFFPFSFFFAAVYGDALYFCLSVWAFYFVQSRRWTVAAALAVMAALTRITGFVLILAVVVEFFRHSPDPRSIRKHAPAIAVLAMAPLILFTYYFVRYGDPIAFVHARQIAWQRATGIAPLLSDLDYYMQGSLLSCGGIRECLRGWDFTRQLLGIWYLVLVPLSIGLAVAARHTIGPGLVIWVIGTYAMALLNGLDGMGRFTAVLFPVFIAAAMLVVRSRAALTAVCLAWVPFLLLFLGGFVRWRAVQ